MGTPRDSEATRKRIIEAAGQLFSEHGFNGVTVRQIVKKADSHLSALNYHFRSKDALYREVLLEACRKECVSIEERQRFSELEPREALFVLVKEALAKYDEPRASNWHFTIMERECWEPTPVFREVVKEYFRPEMDLLAGIVGKITGQPSEAKAVRFAVMSLFGLMEPFGSYSALTEAVAPGLNEFVRKDDWLARQICRLVIEAASPSAEDAPR